MSTILIKGTYKGLCRSLLLLFPAMAILSCNNFSYSLHGAKKKYFARPGLLFMEAIVNYRVQNHFWPGSMRDFSMSSEINHQLAEDFKYNETDFKISDSNHLKIFFYDYKKDAGNPSTAGKIDLNGLRGEMRFFIFGDGFAYKLKMK